jgi:hypothetical protein
MRLAKPHSLRAANERLPASDEAPANCNADEEMNRLSYCILTDGRRSNTEDNHRNEVKLLG